MSDRSDELRSRRGDGQIACTLKPDKLPALLAFTIPGYAAEVMRLHNAEVERRILDGENRIELIYPPDQWRDGDAARTIVYTVPLWRDAFQARLTVEWRRWKHRHSDAGWRFIAAFRWSGTVWGAGQVR